jgi:hypothetical protein
LDKQFNNKSQDQDVSEEDYDQKTSRDGDYLDRMKAYNFNDYSSSHTMGQNDSHRQSAREDSHY